MPTLRHLQNNKFSGSLESLNKLTKLIYMYVLGILASVQIYKIVNARTPTLIRELHNNKFSGSIEYLGDLILLKELFVRRVVSGACLEMKFAK